MCDISKLSQRRTQVSVTSGGGIVTVHRLRRLWWYAMTINDHWHVHVTSDFGKKKRLSNGAMGKLVTHLHLTAWLLRFRSDVTIEREREA